MQLFLTTPKRPPEVLRIEADGRHRRRQIVKGCLPASRWTDALRAVGVDEITLYHDFASGFRADRGSARPSPASE